MVFGNEIRVTGDLIHFSIHNRYTLGSLHLQVLHHSRVRCATPQVRMYSNTKCETIVILAKVLTKKLLGQ